MSTVTILDFDPANYLDSDEVIVEYLKPTAEDPNPRYFLRLWAMLQEQRGWLRLPKKQVLGVKACIKLCVQEHIHATRPLKQS